MLFAEYCNFLKCFRISERGNSFRYNPSQSLKRTFIISGNNCFAENWGNSLDLSIGF